MDRSMEELIRERAYQIWADNGCVAGKADQHWLTAEREVLLGSMATCVDGQASQKKKRPLPARGKKATALKVAS